MAYSSSSAASSSLDWRQLPTTPGVYIYKNTLGRILYVGKAKNLKSRVSSYFQPPTQLGVKTAQLVSQIASIEYIEVQSELEALLLESRLIKRFKPHFNIISKDDKSPYYIHISREPFPKPILNHLPKGAVAGPFLNSWIPRKILREFRRVAPFCTAPRQQKGPCLYSHLGLCYPCPATITTPEQTALYQNHIRLLRRLLSGKFATVRQELEREMSKSAKLQHFEQAAEFRNSLQALQHLLENPVMPDDYLINPNLTPDQRQQALEALKTSLHLTTLNRIEMFDMAHLSGTGATGAMTVAQNGSVDSRHFRHFTIKTAQSNSDVDMMREVLSRRLRHTDWPHPDLIILDGGAPQLSILPTLSQIATPDYCLPPIIALAKKNETIIIPAASGFHEIQLPKNHPGLKLLQNLRDEAHRFSRRLHHQHRKNLLIKN